MRPPASSPASTFESDAGVMGRGSGRRREGGRSAWREHKAAARARGRPFGYGSKHEAIPAVRGEARGRGRGGGGVAGRATRRRRGGAGPPPAVRRLELPQGQAPPRRGPRGGSRARGGGGDGLSLPAGGGDRQSPLSRSDGTHEGGHLLADGAGGRAVRPLDRGRSASVGLACGSGPGAHL